MQKGQAFPLLSKSSFLVPDYLIFSAWTEHAPFAFWLMENLQPRTFVELGTHFGLSYFAMCQLVEGVGLPTSCYAIDTWQGDEHAGFYDDTVYRSVVDANRRYTRFSKLIRATFDEAVDSFSDASIDLLHIDGRHAYEDVKHDFETWRPKLSKRGIVLFHDTTVRERGFGVWRFFDELREAYPTFEFLHGHGLGVLAIGEIPAALKPLFEADEMTTQFVRDSYSGLGRNILRIYEARERLTAVRKHLREASHSAAIKSIEQRDDLIRLLSQLRRPKPVSDMPARLRRRSPFASRDAAYTNFVHDYETLATSPLFDADWYLAKYPDVAEKGEDPVHHYLQYGGTYPMSPGPYFDVFWYLDRNPDVRESKANPLLHFIREGASKRRPLGCDQDKFYFFNSVETKDCDYERWVRDYDTLSEHDRQAIREHVNGFVYKPLISVVMPAYNTPALFFRAAIDSVRNQLYSHWELCIADDASPDPHVAELLREYDTDGRIKWMRRTQNGQISAATNSALDLASGDFVALMDHDDILPERALYEIAREINQHPDVDLIYSDEDKIDVDGRRHDPNFKTNWNRELLLCQNMISHLGVYRRSLIAKVVGLREGFEGSQDYDLALRVADASSADRIRHIPAILYHWRQNSGSESFSEAQLERCVGAAQRAVQESLDRNGENARVERHAKLPAWHRIRRTLPAEQPLVSLIVPTKDMAEMTAKCVDGLLNRTDYSNLEVIIVDHESREASTTALFKSLTRDRRVRIIPFSGPFNYSAINNAAVSHSNGSVLGLINNDINVIEPEWLREMVSLAILPDVGAVGARLLYADGKVQHAGVVLGVGGIANHFCMKMDRNDEGLFGRALLASDVSAVTGACLVVRKSLYDEVGGLDAMNLPIAFNDVDFCLRLRAKGYRNVYTPHAELFHLESASRGSDTHPERIDAFRAEEQYMWDCWADVLNEDPFYNINLSVSIEQAGYACPPRRPKPWVKLSS